MIEIDQEVDRPDASTKADVTLVSRGITTVASVTRSDEHGLVISPVGTDRPWHGAIEPGDAVELYWVSGYEERTLPARVVRADSADGPVWHLRPTGPAQPSGRRRAVRAKVAVPIVIPWAAGRLRGTTIDLSEGGLKALVDGRGRAPGSGTAVEVSLLLEDGARVDLSGDVAWGSDGGTGQWMLAVQFTGLDERTRETLRRRVFRALRDERASDGA